MKKVLFLTCALLLVLGCASDSSELEARLAKLEAENASLKQEPEPQTATTVSATPEPKTTATVSATPEPRATTAATQAAIDGTKFIRKYYVADTGGDGVRPRDECYDSAPRAFSASVQEGEEVESQLRGVGTCAGWYKVAVTDRPDLEFWIRGEYLSLTAPVVERAPTPTPTPVATQTPVPVATPTPPPSCQWRDTIAKVSEATFKVSTVTGWGTAFYIGNGYFVTAAHVIDDDSRFQLSNHIVQSFTGVEVYANKADTVTDIGLLWTDSAVVKSVTPLQWGNSASLYIGESVKTVGYPVASGIGEGAVAGGVVSKIHKEADGTYIQTDTPVNPGNSGGPLVNECGDVIGVITSKVVGTSIEGIAFATSQRTAEATLATLKRGEGVTLPRDIPSTPDIEWRRPVITGMCNAHSRVYFDEICSKSDNVLNVGETPHWDIKQDYKLNSGLVPDAGGWRHQQFEINGNGIALGKTDARKAVEELDVGVHQIRVRYLKHTDESVRDTGWLLWSAPYEFEIKSKIPNQPYLHAICVADGDCVYYLGTYNVWYTIRKSSGPVAGAIDLYSWGTYQRSATTKSFLQVKFLDWHASQSSAVWVKSWCTPRAAAINIKGKNWVNDNCLPEGKFSFTLLGGGFFYEVVARLINSVGEGLWSFPIRFYLKE